MCVLCIFDKDHKCVDTNVFLYCDALLCSIVLCICYYANYVIVDYYDFVVVFEISRSDATNFFFFFFFFAYDCSGYM